MCLDRKTGKTLWQQVATRLIPHEGTHGDNNFASGSPTTDGERLYCWFGSSGLFCYDLIGKILFQITKTQLIIVRDPNIQVNLPNM